MSAEVDPNHHHHPHATAATTTAATGVVTGAVTGAAVANAVVWFFILLIVIAIIAAIIIWIVVICCGKPRTDIDAHDICACTVKTSGDVIIGQNACVGGTLTADHLISNALSVQPVSNAELAISMSGRRSAIKITNQSGSAVTITLPDGQEIPAGLIVIIANNSASATFNVQPRGTDTLNGGTIAVAINNTKAMFYNSGIDTATNIVQWVQLLP